MNCRIFAAIASIFFFTELGFPGNGVERFDFEPSFPGSMSERATDKFVHFINENCSSALLKSKKVNLELVEIKMNKIDQGIIDYTYTVNVNFHDLLLSKVDTAQVTLTDFAGTNPTVDWVQIDDVRVTNTKLCDFK